MGVVYKARQASLNRIVAVKMILKGELATANDVRRFRQEAQAAGNLDHANIVPIYEVSEHEGQQYFSMKLVGPGKRRTELGLRETARVAALVARAVHHAHQRGILHRDLKPSNVLFDENGEPCVGDFGLARPIEGDSGITRSGTIVGTPSYMAPEQALAEKVLTTAVDVYSLGAVLYEWITGQPPFRGADAVSTMMQVIAEEPRPPRSLNRQVDRNLETICLKCLDKDPARRYGSAEAAAEDLERWQRGEPIQARPASSWERSWRWCRRKPALAAASAAAALGVLLALITFGVAFLVVSESRDDAIDSAKKEYDQRVRAENLAAENDRLAIKADQRREDAEKLAEANKLMALQARFDNLYFRSREEPAVALIGAAQLLPEVLTFKDQALADSIMVHLDAWSDEVRRLCAVFSHQNDVEAVAISPDGKTVLTGSVDGTAQAVVGGHRQAARPIAAA